ncbi:MAG: DUF3179 domain-containing protein [Rhodobacteraceae bacterium]|nr:DUF3179 domain-containing protein [Paracoccaceae bacterium]
MSQIRAPEKLPMLLNAAPSPVGIVRAALACLAATACAALLFAAPALADERPPQVRAWAIEFPLTDFARSSIDFADVREGGPPRDGIPAIDDPRFHPVASETTLSGREAVISIALPGETPRAYPLRYLMWHEIVNDRIGGRAVAVTYCPLCNSAMVFEASQAGAELTFGVTGKLRHSDMLMYDRETESWWQQAVGEAVVGLHTGARLQHLPSRLEGWAQFAARHPEGLVLSQPRAIRPYGSNPYVRYDSAIRPFLYDGALPPHGIEPLARVVRVEGRAWPLSRLRAEGRIEEAGLVLHWSEGQASALDSSDIGAGREVGSVIVQDARGRDVAHDIPFAFAFDAFFPDGEWMLGPR